MYQVDSEDANFLFLENTDSPTHISLVSLFVREHTSPLLALMGMRANRHGSCNRLCVNTWMRRSIELVKHKKRFGHVLNSEDNA
jgi:hypothetical protein